MTGGFHQPVLPDRSVAYVLTRPDGTYLDCTLGGGGHSALFLEHLTPGGFLVGIDADEEAVSHARKTLSKFSNIHLRQSFYDQLEIVLYETGRYPVDGVFYDLGISSYQVDTPERGFAFRFDGPLDMRMDRRQPLSAAGVLNTYSEGDLGRVFREYGEERYWRRIAGSVCIQRSTVPLQRAGDLVEIVRRAVGERHLNKSLARIFQALRIEVNRELERLAQSLESAFRMLRKGGRLVVISYHSLEDRIVKTFIRDKNRDCVCPPELPECRCGKVSEMQPLTRRPVKPDENEVRVNPRARSARLRAAEKIVPFVPAV